MPNSNEGDGLFDLFLSSRDMSKLKFCDYIFTQVLCKLKRLKTKPSNWDCFSKLKLTFKLTLWNAKCILCRICVRSSSAPVLAGQEDKLDIRIYFQVVDRSIHHILRILVHHNVPKVLS